MWVIRALYNVTAARHVILAISRTVNLVRIIAAVVLLVALECRVDALAVRTVERTCIVTEGLSFRSVRKIPGGPGRRFMQW